MANAMYVTNTIININQVHTARTRNRKARVRVLYDLRCRLISLKEKVNEVRVSKNIYHINNKLSSRANARLNGPGPDLGPDLRPCPGGFQRLPFAKGPLDRVPW